MTFIVEPPNFLKNNFFDKDNIDLYNSLLLNYCDDDNVFKIIKNNGTIKNITKKECIEKSSFLAKEIVNLVDLNIDRNQLKIFAVIGASEESCILMLSSLLLGAHHCICFEDLSSEAIKERKKIFKPGIVIYS